MSDCGCYNKSICVSQAREALARAGCGLERITSACVVNKHPISTRCSPPLIDTWRYLGVRSSIGRGSSYHSAFFELHKSPRADFDYFENEQVHSCVDMIFNVLKLYPDIKIYILSRYRCTKLTKLLKLHIASHLHACIGIYVF